MPHDDKDSKIFDISKPHKITPSASSRPVIVGHHPVMPDPMVLEERYRHPEPLHSRTTKIERPQTPMPKALNNTFPQASPDTPSDTPTSVSSTTNGAYTTYGTSTQPTDNPPETQPQISSVAPILDRDTSSSDMDQRPDITLPVMQQQPLPENPLHVPAGAASRSHDKNQILLALTLFIVIVVMALLAMHFLLK
jgi:hypothetical protein